MEKKYVFQPQRWNRLIKSRVPLLRDCVLSVCALFVLNACVTKPVDEKKVPALLISNCTRVEGKLMVQDLMKNQTHYLDAILTHSKNDYMRLEISATFGIQVATFVLNKGKVKYLLPRQKKYFEGSSTDKVFRPVFPLPISPETFINIVEKKPEANWTCETTSASCLIGEKSIQIAWELEGELVKRIDVNASQFKMRLQISNSKTNIQEKDSVFNLVPPDGYKTYRLN